MRKNLFSLFFVSVLFLSGCGLTVDDKTPVDSDLDLKEEVNEIDSKGDGKVIESSIDSTIKPKNNLVEVDFIRVVDGDTIKVSYNGKNVSVRMLLIDTPETKHVRL